MIFIILNMPNDQFCNITNNYFLSFQIYFFRALWYVIYISVSFLFYLSLTVNKKKSSLWNSLKWDVSHLTCFRFLILYTSTFLHWRNHNILKPRTSYLLRIKTFYKVWRLSLIDAGKCNSTVMHLYWSLLSLNGKSTNSRCLFRRAGWVILESILFYFLFYHTILLF